MSQYDSKNHVFIPDDEYMDIEEDWYDTLCWLETKLDRGTLMLDEYGELERLRIHYMMIK